MNSKQLIKRRELLITGFASLSALLLPGCKHELPPTYGNILRMGDAFTYGAQRTLLSGKALSKEYSYGDISSFPATGTTNPSEENYVRLRAGAFADWLLPVEGHVARPGSYSLADLQRFPMRKQITKHTCEEGWTAIAEWTGVQLSRVLESAGMLPSARFINFYTYDGWADSIDMLDALHPQASLAYGMNGRNLPIAHGAPVRLRVENQLGYKSLKFVQRIVVSDKFDDFGEAGNLKNGWAWYVGI